MTNMRNSVQLIGRPGTDPEVKTFENKRTVAHFNLAVNSNYKNAEQKRVDHTQWFPIVAWDKLAETMGNLVKKGKQVAIEGSLRNRDWMDNNGVRHLTTEILASSFVLIDPVNHNATKG